MNARFRMRRIGKVQLLVACTLAAMLLLSACSKKKQAVETDASTGESIPTEQVPPQGFGGESTGSGQVESSDVNSGASLALEDVFFDYDKFDLDAGDREILAANGRLLREAANASILIEGHCDERGTVQYNLALGEKRARQVMDYLASLGISTSNVEIVSYGKERPFATGSTEAAWSQNRRAHFVVK